MVIFIPAIYMLSFLGSLTTTPNNTTPKSTMIPTAFSAGQTLRNPNNEQLMTKWTYVLHAQLEEMDYFNKRMDTSANI